jgi:hypothetical protein
MGAAVLLLLALQEATPSELPCVPSPEIAVYRYSIHDSRRNEGWGAADSADGNPLAWSGGPILADYVDLFRLTGERYWLDQLCRQFDRMLENAVELEGDGLGWPSRRYTRDGSPQVYLVHEGMILLPVVQFAVLAGEDPRVPPDLAEKAEGYLEPILGRFLPKWDASWLDLSDSTGAYCFPDDPAERFPGRPLPYNQMAPVARMFYLLQDVRELPVLLARARAMTRLLQGGLHREGEGWTWDYWSVPEAGEAKVEDSSHGSLEVALAVEAYRRGEIFTEEDIERFSATLLVTMWNGSEDDPRVSRNVDGTGGETPLPVRGWVDLGTTRPEVLDLFCLLFRVRGEPVTEIPALLGAGAEVAPR